MTQLAPAKRHTPQLELQNWVPVPQPANSSMLTQRAGPFVSSQIREPHAPHAKPVLHPESTHLPPSVTGVEPSGFLASAAPASKDGGGFGVVPVAVAAGVVVGSGSTLRPPHATNAKTGKAVPRRRGTSFTEAPG
jgi:hypothetical protein